MTHTKTSSAQRFLRAALVLALAATLVPLAGCGLFGTGGSSNTDQTPPPALSGGLPTTQAPSVPPGSRPTTPEPPARRLGMKVYFTIHEKVQPMYRSVPYSTAVVKSAVTALLAGPTASERAQGLVSEVPKGTKVLGASLKNGVAYIDLSTRFEAGGGSLSEILRLAQLVYTATQFPGVKSVVLKMNGKTVEVFSGEGIDLEGQPQKRSDYEDSTPGILIDMPAWGATEHHPAYFKGTANVFEAQFTLQILAPSGKLVATKQVTASSGTGTRGTWSASVPYSIAESGWGKVKVFDISQSNGLPENALVVPVYLVK